MAKDFKLDIFWLLNQINSKNPDIWAGLSEEQQKAFSPLVVNHWLAGSPDPEQLETLNAVVGEHSFSLAKHPELLLKLMASCGNKKSQRFVWRPFTKNVERKATISLIKEVRECSSREARKFVNVLSAKELLALATDINWEKDDINKLKKELGVK